MQKKDILIILSVVSLTIFMIITMLWYILRDFKVVIEENTGTPISWTKTLNTVLSQNFDGIEELNFKTEHLEKQIGKLSIYHDAGLPYLETLTLDSITKAELLTRKYLGPYEHTSVDLLLMDMNELSHFSDLPLIGGFYSDFEKIIVIGLYEEDLTRIQNQDQTYPYELEKTVLHEYTHYAMERRLEHLQTKKETMDLPIWFAEGVATYIENQEDFKRWDSFTQKIIPFDALQTQEDWQTARVNENADVYKQSLLAVHWLIQTHGESIVETLLIEATKRASFDEAMLSLTGLKKETMHEEIFPLK